MADTLPDNKIPRHYWVSLSAITGIASGQAMEIQNKGEAAVLLFEGSAQPSPDYEDGPFLHPFPSTLSVVKVLLGSGDVWVKTSKCASLDGLINVQEL